MKPNRRYVVGTVLSILASIILLLAVVPSLWLFLHPEAWPQTADTENPHVQATLWVLTVSALLPIVMVAVGTAALFVLVMLVITLVHRKELPRNIFWIRVGFAGVSLAVMVGVLSWFFLS